jgi:hypothetical protein
MDFSMASFHNLMKLNRCLFPSDNASKSTTQVAKCSQSHQSERISREAWNKFEDIIRDKKDELTLTDLMKFMETEHGFNAT